LTFMMFLVGTGGIGPITAGGDVDQQAVRGHHEARRAEATLRAVPTECAYWKKCEKLG
jgi:hypothetical protein